MLRNGLAFYNVSGAFDTKHSLVNKVCVKRFKTHYSTAILFESFECGSDFSFTIEKSFSKTNIENFLKSKFKNINKNGK